MRRDDEHDLAAICHLCNAIPLWGLIICSVMWLYKREKSRYLALQAQQAMYFHGLLLLVIAVWGVVELLTRLLRYLIYPLGYVLDFLNLIIIGCVIVLYICFCLWGAWQSYSGVAFRYPLVGDRPERTE